MKQACNHIVFMTLLFLFFPHPLNGASNDTQRIWAGLDLFPSILAADRDIDSKTGSDGKLLLLLKYTDDREAAGKLASHLKKITTIHGNPVRIELSNNPSFNAYRNTPVAGIFIAQKLNSLLTKDTIHFGKEHHVVIFSPFKGDVEAGVSGGIIISDRILPYVNTKTMRESSIRLKSFFLRIAKTHE